MEGASTAAIEVVLQNLINVAKDEYSLIRGLDQEAEQLQTTLGQIQTYLNDAEKKSISLAAIKLWLWDLEASAFDADNISDELSYHLLRKQVKAPNNKVNADFRSKNKTATELGLRSILMNAALTAALHASTETSSVAIDPIFIGGDVVESEIVDQLTRISREEKISVLAIVGMGGIGKTMLTRKVFNHEKIKARFGSRIWVHVSEIFDPNLLIKKILSKLTSQTSDVVGIKEEVLERFQEDLKPKTYLLVHDDIWNENVSKWEDLINSILGATSTMGNGILMSIRNENVASVVRLFHIHPLKGPSVEECWSIIKA